MSTLLPHDESMLSPMHQYMSPDHNRTWVLKQLRTFPLADIVMIQINPHKYQCGACTMKCERTEFFLQFWAKPDGSRLFEMSTYTGDRYFVLKLFDVLFCDGEAHDAKDLMLTPLQLPNESPTGSIFMPHQLEILLNTNSYADCRLSCARDLASSQAEAPAKSLIEILPDRLSDMSRCLHTTLMRLHLNADQTQQVRKHIQNLLRHPLAPLNIEYVLAMRTASKLLLHL